MLATILLLGLVGVAVITDFRWKKIYNWTTYPGILAAFALSGLGSLLVAFGVCNPQQLEWLVRVPIDECLLGFLVCGAIMLLCFVLFGVGIGGGDVKLITMMGALMGLRQGLEAMLWTFVFGGCAGLIVLVWRVGPWRLFVRGIRQILWSLRIGQWSALTPDERAQLQPPVFLAPCALAAVVVVRFSLINWLR